MKGCSGESPNSVTLVSVVSACSSLLYPQFGRQVHGLARKTDVGFDTMVGTALVDMYSNCGKWKWAYDVYQELNGNRNSITWNSMIAGMMLNGQSGSAIEFFARLVSEGLKPDSATWNSMGTLLELAVKKSNDPAIWNVMISGCGKNGEIESGLCVSDQMIKQKVKPNTETFNCILSMCSHTGQVEKGWEIFRMMSRDYGLSPTPEHINCIVDLLGRSGA
ncbi:pentatricopeptide repeat-containing protein At2g02750-like [Actinidia eriantha]|uniref:pentatricopeptide repeat-containing protein At2g02750-like n=1 Tax=Actinidia eriantha TaxID=165200 RepID=UPI00258D7E3C|nr:pentatricopeptide repeat-containing protein At2g02750-like [Actinidia eriantha]